MTASACNPSRRVAALAALLSLAAGCGAASADAGAPSASSSSSAAPRAQSPSSAMAAPPAKPVASAAVSDPPEDASADANAGRALVRMLLRAVGVGSRQKIDECNSLIQVINEGVQNLEKGSSTPNPDGVADLRNMADAMDAVARDAAAVKLTIPELVKASAEYQTMARAVAKAARDMATAAAAKDVNAINGAQASMEKAVKKEDPLVDRINAFCQAP